MTDEESTPFLITPPPGIAPAKAAPVEAEPVVAPPVDFISLPPGVSDSATVKLTHSRVGEVPHVAVPSGAPAPIRTPGLAPVVVPGLPTPATADPAAAPVLAPAPTPALVTPAVAPDTSAPATTPTAVQPPAVQPPAVQAPAVLAPAVQAVAAQPTAVQPPAPPTPPSAYWKLALPHGQQAATVTGTLYVGRNPSAAPSHAHAALLAVVDPAKSVSKTHALLEADATDLWVSDLDSTNGVFITTPSGDERQVFPGERASVPAGGTLELGEYVIHVSRA